MRRLLVAVALGVLLAAGVADAPQAATPPRVLAIHFNTDVNPVTQDWLNHQLDRAASGGYYARP